MLDWNMDGNKVFLPIRNPYYIFTFLWANKRTFISKELFIEAIFILEINVKLDSLTSLNLGNDIVLSDT